MNALGIDIGGTKIAFALVNPSGEVIRSRRLPTHAPDGVEAVISQIISGVEQLDAGDVIGCGIGCPGHIDARAGRVNYAANLGWQDVPLLDLLRLRLTLPLRLENDAVTALMGEIAFGAAKGVKDAALLSIGTGLGAAAMVDGHILHGAAHFAMEFGQMILRDHPLEQTASGTGLSNLVDWLRADYPASTLPPNADTAAILHAARADDPLARAALDTMIADVVQAALWTCSILNPSRLIIGGGMGQAVAPELMPALEDAITRRTSPPVREAVTLHLAQVVQTAVGAAALFLNDPAH